MNDGLGRPQTVLVLGGTSQIGGVIADALLTGPGTVVLAGRDLGDLNRAAQRLVRPDRAVETMHYDATAPAAAAVDLLAAWPRPHSTSTPAGSGPRFVAAARGSW